MTGQTPVLEHMIETWAACVASLPSTEPNCEAGGSRAGTVNAEKWRY